MTDIPVKRRCGTCRDFDYGLCVAGNEQVNALDLPCWDWVQAPDDPDDGQPTEAQEWRDFDAEC